MSAKPTGTPPPGPMSVMVIYRLKSGCEEKFMPLLKKHWPMLQRAGLVSPQAPKFWRTETREGALAYVETFQWKDFQAPNTAHQLPEVMQVWEPMGDLLEKLEILHANPVELL